MSTDADGAWFFRRGMPWPYARVLDGRVTWWRTVDGTDGQWRRIGSTFDEAAIRNMGFARCSSPLLADDLRMREGL